MSALKKLLRFLPVAFLFLALLSASVTLFSCTEGHKKSLIHLSDMLNSDYTANVSFTVSSENNQYAGCATITKDAFITRLDIHSPNPFSGLSIEYNIKGLPESIAMHFSGLSAMMPKDAAAKINPIASIFADDFASNLSKIPKSDISEYTDNSGAKGLYTSLAHNGANITLYFSPESSVPQLIEYLGKDCSASITFDNFSVMQKEEAKE